MTQQEAGTEIDLRITDEGFSGTLALRVTPGTVAAKRDAMVAEVLSERLYEVAAELKVVLAADAYAYTHPQPGLDEQGRVVFTVRGRIEGDLLIPTRNK